MLPDHPERRRAGGVPSSLQWWCCFLLGIAILVIHFGLLQIDNMPLSPLKLRLENVIAAYVNPFFTQRWNFFAPTPPVDSDWIVVRARPAPSPADAGVSTPWCNVSATLESAVSNDRFTPMFLVEIGLSNAAGAFMNSLATDPRASVDRDGKVYLKSDLPSDDAIDLEYIQRTAAAYMETVYPGQSFSQIQVGILRQHYPRFTRRTDTDVKDTMTLATTPWAPFPRVTPFCCAGHSSR